MLTTGTLFSGFTCQANEFSLYMVSRGCDRVFFRRANLLLVSRRATAHRLVPHSQQVSLSVLAPYTSAS